MEVRLVPNDPVQQEEKGWGRHDEKEGSTEGGFSEALFGFLRLACKSSSISSNDRESPMDGRQS